MTIHHRRIWNNSLVTIGILGILSLLLSHFARPNDTLLMFGQILSITAFSALFFFCYMLILRGCGRTTPVLLLLIGACGKVFGASTQIMLHLVGSKPQIISVAETMMSIGIIILLNKFYGRNLRS